MENAVTIRNATEQNLPSILDIYNEVILNTTSVYSEQPHTLQMRTTWFRERKAANFPVIVAELDGVIIGFASYGHFRVWPCYRFTAEHSVYIHTGYRGRGVSKILLQAIIANAKNAGLHALIAGIDSENAISLKLHRSFGFVQVAHFKEVGFKFNRWLDLIFMELLLE